MLRRKKKADKTALVIVAHPDDETIWMGGFILKHPEIKWTILSLCRARDKDRAPKFFKVCRRLNARGLMADLDDEDKLTLDQTLPVIKKLIKQKIKNKSWDYIFTHGANGEYGHPRHIGTHKAVKKMAGEKELKAEQVFFFNYKKASRRQFSLLKAKVDSDIKIKLTREEFVKKKKIMAEIYGFDPKGIDASYCTNPESFKNLTPNN